MAAVVLDIADAVVTALNAASLSQSFTAERAYVPIHELQDLADLKVSVVARSLSLVWLSRRDDDFSYIIDIGIQKSIGIGGMSNAEIIVASDPFMLLAEEILDLFRGKPLGNDDQLQCMAAENVPIYAPLHLDEKRVFTSVVSLTFKKARPR